MTEIKAKFDPELRKSIKNKSQVAIIPIGSIEQHGPHLPISTDSDIVTEVSKKIAEKNGFQLLPTITYGVSFEHAPFFNLSIRESTLRSVVSDLCVSLLENKIKTVFIINGHHGNLKPLKNIDIKLKKLTKNKLKVFSFSYWHFTEREFDHAGFVETSLMLAISKNIKMKKAEKGLITDGMSKQEIKKLGKLANESFPKVTKNGIWGDPTKATKKDGHEILAEIVKNLGKKCQTCLTGHSS
ncbi:creatininase family protein [Nitrosopumilus sp.]|uniref:creatininase family protein n=1 Tax=Nitrosopumilus sp. TaxID=2024843 RepID=UPI002609E5D4|nr:creatininase family protein [Nitrosopumilus sp.]